MLRSASMSRCPRLTTATYPLRRGTILLWIISEASVPGSMRSSFVRTPMVLSPLGSSCLASFRASLLARSVFALVTARIIALGLEAYWQLIEYICSSMSSGWSLIATFVSPGRSTIVRLSTSGLYILRCIGVGLTPLEWRPARRFVSRLISSRIWEKS